MTDVVERAELAPGLSVSRILTGLWQIADMERTGRSLDAAACADAMVRHVEAGLTSFDMADHYGSAELIAGAYAATVGGEGAEFLTKWVPTPGAVTRSAVREAVERSMERLSTDRIDLLQFHAWRYPDPGWLDCLFHLQDLKDEGLILHLGVTNFDTAHLRMALRSGIDIVSNQVSYSLLDGRAATGMTELCEEHGVKILAFGTLAGGFMTERWLGRTEPGPEALETWSQMKYKRFIDAAGGWAGFQRLLAAVKGVADRHGVSMANVATRTILDRPGVAGAIVGARLGERDHIADNLRTFSFALDDESREELDRAAAGLEAVPGDCGDEYRRPPFLTAAGDLSHHLDELPPPYTVRAGPGDRVRCLSGTVWEDRAGFSRAVRKGKRILVSGTTATHGSRLIGGADAEAQADFCIDKIEGAVISLGGTLEDIVRTRLYVAEGADADAVSRAHGRRLGHVQPANTLVRAGLVGVGYLVEVEAEAELA